VSAVAAKASASELEQVDFSPFSQLESPSWR